MKNTPLANFLAPPLGGSILDQNPPNPHIAHPYHPPLFPIDKDPPINTPFRRRPFLPIARSPGVHPTSFHPVIPNLRQESSPKLIQETTRASSSSAVIDNDRFYSPTSPS
ncbi:unnamed protein product [Linum trigynum]|uniref:Uncharacterized protein n=1 Tax=Linum trigynum TaxID=586398 RepID=A0AAV2GVP7_9ROSI